MKLTINDIKLQIEAMFENGINIEQSDDSMLELEYQGFPYCIKLVEDEKTDDITASSNQRVLCQVIYKNDNGDAFEINDALEKLLTEKFELQQSDFQIGFHQALSIIWQFNDEALEEGLVKIFEHSKEILEKIKVQITELIQKLQSQQDEQGSQEQDTSEKSKPENLLSSIELFFKQQDWKYQMAEVDTGFLLKSGFGTKVYLDKDKDNYLPIHIRFDGKNYLTFYSPFAYNLHQVEKTYGVSTAKDSRVKNITSDVLIARQAKLALLNLKMSSSHKYGSMSYDRDDGEVRYEISMYAEEQTLLTNNQVKLGTFILREILESHHTRFIDGVLNDNTSIEEFSLQLFEISKPDSNKEMVEVLSSQGVDLEGLSYEQKERIAKKIAELSQDIINEESSSH